MLFDEKLYFNFHVMYTLCAVMLLDNLYSCTIQLDIEADAKVSSLISATLFHRVEEEKPDDVSITDKQRAFKRTRTLAICKENDTPSVSGIYFSKLYAVVSVMTLSDIS